MTRWMIEIVQKTKENTIKLEKAKINIEVFKVG